MKDLTKGSIVGNIVAMAVPIAAGTVFQTVYLLVDLYFVAALGDGALAGVSAAGTLVFLTMALNQVLSAGAVALVSQAVGRKDRDDANQVFNQSLVIASLFAGATLAVGYAGSAAYVAAVTPDVATRIAGTTYLYGFLPGLALQFVLVAIGSALRGTGVVKPTMIVQSFSVLLNVVLAPVLIAGWGTGWPLGVAGAGLASTLSIASGLVMLGAYVVRRESYVEFLSALWRPHIPTCKRLLAVGLPTCVEFVLVFVYLAVVYRVISDFGVVIQAAFGIGSRIVQSIYLPVMVIAVAAGPIAGQNFGAGEHARVRETFSKALLLNSAVMLLVTLLLQWRPEALLAFFSTDAEVMAASASFLRVISLAFVADSVAFTCSAMFRGLGNTRPALASCAVRMAVFVPLAVWLPSQPGFRFEDVWYLSVATIWLQAAVSYLLLRVQFRRRLAKALDSSRVPDEPWRETDEAADPRDPAVYPPTGTSGRH